MFLKLKFLEGWSLESRRQKKMNKIYVVFFLNIYFLKGWPRENRRQKKTWPKYKFYFLKT